MLRLEENAIYDRIEAESPRLRLQLFIREKSAFYQAYLIVKQLMAPGAPGHKVDLKHKAISAPFAKTGLSPDLPFPELTKALEALKGRITKLAILSQGSGAKAIFVTQRSATWKRNDGKISGNALSAVGFYVDMILHYGPMNGQDFHRLEQLVSDAILEACNETKSVCIDLMGEIDLDTQKDSYDPVHTNASGAQAIGRFLINRLQPADIPFGKPLNGS